MARSTAHLLPKNIKPPEVVSMYSPFLLSAVMVLVDPLSNELRVDVRNTVTYEVVAPLWSNKCACQGNSPGRLEILDNGNLVVVDGGGTVLWESGTSDGKRPVHSSLVMEINGGVCRDRTCQ